MHQLKWSPGPLNFIPPVERPTTQRVAWLSLVGDGGSPFPTGQKFTHSSPHQEKSLLVDFSDQKIIPSTK